MLEGAPVSVKDFGAVGDGVTDDTVAIQAAVDTGREVSIPSGTYVVSDTITSVALFIHGAAEKNSSKIVFTPTTEIPLFETTGYSYNGKTTHILNLTINGTYGGSADLINQPTCFKFVNETQENLGASVQNCNITGFKKAILVSGRGLYLDNNFFSRCLDAVYFKRVLPVNEGPDDDQNTESGMRAYWIRNCRFHSMGSSSIITNIEDSADNLRGILFEGNYIDSAARIMNGACRESLFTGNTHIYGNSGDVQTDNVQVLFFSSFGRWENVTITNNNFSSLQATASTVARGSEYIVKLGASQDVAVNGLIFSNNTIQGVYNEAIKINTTTGNNIVISGNSFNDACMNAKNGSTRLISLNTSSSIRGVNISNNILKVFNESDATVQSNLDYAIYLSGDIERVKILNNIVNTSIIKEANKFCSTQTVGTYTTTLVSSQGDTFTLDSTKDTLYYHKTGNSVTVSGSVSLSAIPASPTGRLQLSLPFTSTILSSGENSDIAHANISINDATINVAEWVGWIDDGSDVIDIYRGDVAAVSSSNDNTGIIKNTSVIHLSVTYIVPDGI